MKKSGIKNILREINKTSNMFRQLGENAEKINESFKNLGLSINGLVTLKLKWGEK